VQRNPTGTAITSGRQARRGRPPGPRPEASIRREKVTVWLRAELIAQYRDWSWECRCQLSSLVEIALEEYHGRRRSLNHVAR
jgi:hypothetical protein